MALIGGIIEVLAFGSVAILSYPATLFVDWFAAVPDPPDPTPMPAGATPEYPALWTGLLGLFLVVAVLAGMAAIAYGFTAA